MAGESYAARRKGQPQTTSFIQSGVSGGVYAPQKKAAEAVKTPKVSAPKAFTNKLGNIGSQALDINAAVIKKTGDFVRNSAVDIAGAAKLAVNTGADIIAQPKINRNIREYQKQIDSQQDFAAKAYRAGKMSKEDYTKSLTDASAAYQSLTKESQKISQGPTPKERAQAVFETGINALSLGALTLGKAASKELVKQGIKSYTKNTAKQIDVVLAKEATKLEKAITRVPAVKALVVRNANTAAKRELQMLDGESATQYAARLGKNAAFGLLIKRPIFYQSNIGGANEVYSNIIEGDYPGAVKQTAWLATQAINGGPLGLFSKGYNYMRGGLRELQKPKGAFVDKLTGEVKEFRGAYLDELGKKMGVDLYDDLAKTTDPTEFKRKERIYKILQEVNMRGNGEDAVRAAEATLSNYPIRGNVIDVTPERLLKDLENHRDADQLIQTFSGKLKNVDVDSIVPVRFDAELRDTIANLRLDAGNDIQKFKDDLQQLADQPNSGFQNNETLMEQIDNILNTKLDATEAYRAIKSIDAAKLVPELPAEMVRQAAKFGYTYAIPKGGRRVAFQKEENLRDLVRTAMQKPLQNADTVEAPLSNAFITSMSKGLQKMGISIEASTQAATQVLSRNVAARLAQTVAGKQLGVVRSVDNNVDEAGRMFLQRLQQYVDDKKPNNLLNLAVLGRAPGPAITDIRQLTVKEIEEALGVVKAQAQDIKKAIVKGYLDTPMEFRGLGDKIVDNLYRAPLNIQGGYSRIQSALRYTYNPFFRFQEKVETSLLSRAQARTIMWPESKAELNRGAQVLDDSGVFKNGLSGEAAQDLTIGKITATITNGQKRNIAGLAFQMAKARGVTIEELVKDHGDDVGDALRVVVQYPNKGILNSSIARTLNLAFFPMRYNAKVTILAAQILSKEPPSVQLAVINSVLGLKDWLKSDEGIRWSADHADAMQVFNWATPIGSINYWNKIFTDGDPNAPGDFGALGGLPLGIISQALDSQGLIHLNTPYADPKTGDVLPKYIPESAKARASVAVTDILGSMFTYPGRILGLPGKQQSLNKFSQQLTGAEFQDYRIEDQSDRLTPLQKNMIRVLRGDASDDAIDALYRSPADGQQGYTIPDFDQVIKPAPKLAPAVTRRTDLPTKSQKKAATKAAKTPRATTALPIPK